MKKLHLPQLLSKCHPAMHCSPHSWDWTVKIGMRQETVSSDSELYCMGGHHRNRPLLPCSPHSAISLLCSHSLGSRRAQVWGAFAQAELLSQQAAHLRLGKRFQISLRPEAHDPLPAHAAAPHTYPLSVNTEANSQPMGEQKVGFVYRDCFV